VFFRRADRSSASAISALLNSSAEDLATISRHIADNDLPAWNGRWMVTPCDLAHPIISSAVRGPQFRATARSLKRSFRSSSPVGIHLPLGGASPVISTANSFKTFSARVLNGSDRAAGSVETLFGIRDAFLSRIAKPAPAAGPSPGVEVCAEMPVPSRTRPAPARCCHVSRLLAFVAFTARALLACVERRMKATAGGSMAR